MKRLSKTIRVGVDLCFLVLLLSASTGFAFVQPSCRGMWITFSSPVCDGRVDYSTTGQWKDPILFHYGQVVSRQYNSLSSDEFREKVEERYGSKIDDELWQQAMTLDVGQSKANDPAVLIRCQIFAVQNQILEAKKKNLEAEIKILQAETQNLNQQVDKPEKQLFVSNVSQAANDPALRLKFREEQVGDVPCRGGFVCHRMFIEFAKASHLMYNGTPERSEELQLLKTDMESVEKELYDVFGSVLTDGRSAKDLFSKDYPDEEEPQSAVAAEMFRFALDRLKLKQQIRKETSEVRKESSIIVSHQFAIVAAIDEGSVNCLLKSKRKDFSLEPQNEASGASKTHLMKVDMNVDILCWFVHMAGDRGANCLASVEYEPSTTDDDQREAQADMCASNIQIIQRKPCLSIDISGGNDFAKWTISVRALAIRPKQFRQDIELHMWDKSPLYSGEGIPAIVRVAAGLLASLPHVPVGLDDFGKRLENAVGRSGNTVFKAYDGAGRTDNPNINVVRESVDSEATFWQSEDTPLKIIEMAHQHNDWTENVRVESFLS
jgi:hypothetical protein